MTLLHGWLGQAPRAWPETTGETALPIGTYSAADLTLTLTGRPRWAGESLGVQQIAERLAHAFRSRGEAALADIQGRFAFALTRPQTQELLLATDRFGIEPVYLCADTTSIAYSSHLAQLRGVPGKAELDLQALFNYVYFHCIPAPRTIFTGIQKLPAGFVLRWRPGRGAEMARYWTPQFAEDEAPGNDEELQQQLRELLSRAVDRCRPGLGPTGAYLSGGLDSSTVVANLAGLGTEPVPTFSIGFDAEGYDELAYARIVSDRFRTRPHELYVTPRDVLDSLPRLAAGYDQPFGNASAIPAYHCARLAHEHGVNFLLAGDGGDEIFGGNFRYAKQGLFERYQHLPGWLRGGLIEPAALPLAARVPALNKLGNYIKQARIPLPARLQAYNQVERLGVGALFSGEFLDTIDRHEPTALQQAEYAAAPARHYVNRLLALDGKFTLADNDLPKVVGTAALAGVEVAFPMLDDELVAFAYRLSPRQKVAGMALRPLFRAAMKNILPRQTLSKAKHGFGLPFGVWLGADVDLQAMADASLSALARRGWFNADLLAQLRDELHRSHLAYWGELVWVLVMLEQWLQQQTVAKTP
ncbi:MAG: asparagine synthetase B family protein [Immundisolibacter sp.]|uniref:asparagine synthetase B family protein n=1 Tax=Immundisolibacter sp. TaxID=1934948 RepID=UPI003EE1796F